MKFAATLFAQVLLATAALAVPTSNERFADRLARRASGLTRQSLPKQPSENLITNTSHVEYSSNWAGAVLVASKVHPAPPSARRPRDVDVDAAITFSGHLHLRDGYLHGPHPERAFWRLWVPRRLRMGWHRR